VAIFLAVLSLVGSLVALVLGILVLTRNARESLNRVFLLLCLSVAYSAFCQLQIRLADDFADARLWVHIASFWPMSVSFMLHFVLIFTKRARLLGHKSIYLAIYGPTLISSLIGAVYSVGGDPVLHSWGWTYGTLQSPFDYYTVGVIGLMTVVSLALCADYHLRQKNSLLRKQSGLVLLGLAIPAAANFISEIMAPALGVRLPEVNSFAFAAGAGGVIGYTMWRYELFSLTPARAADDIISTMPDGMILVNLDERIAALNESAHGMLGYEQNELVGKPIDVLFVGEASLMRNGGATNGGKALRDFESTLVRKDGTEFPVSVASSDISDRQGRVWGSVLVMRDMTEHKLAEQALSESELRYRLLFELSPDGIMILDLNGNITMCNSQVFGTHGFHSSDELIGRNGAEFLLPEDRHRMFEDLRQILEHPGKMGEGPVVEYDLLRGDSGTWPASIKGSLVRDASGKPTGFMLIMRDVSESKKADEAIRESEARYRTLFETSPDGIALADIEGNILMANQVVAGLLGLDGPEQMIGRKNIEFIAESDLERMAASFPQVLAGGFKNQEFKLRRQDGTTFPADVCVSPILGPQGESVSMITVIRDITQRRQAEEALRVSEARYRELIDISPDDIAEVDLEGNFLFLNRSAAEAHGFASVDEMMKHSFTDLIAPEDRESALESMREVFQKGALFNQEYTFLRKDGSRFPVEANAAAIKDADGNPKAIMGNIRDISGRKQAELVLAQQKDELAEKNFELEALYRVSHATAISQNTDELLANVLESISGVIGDLQTEPQAGIFLVEHDRLRLAARTGVFQDDFIDMHRNIRVGECLCGLAVQMGEVIVSDNSTEDVRHFPYAEGQPEHGHIIVPLRTMDKVVGVLFLYLPADTMEIPERRLRLLESIGARVATAIENVRLNETARELSLHDPLTGLANRRLMNIELDKCMARAKRSQTPFSLIMLDIDTFKNYNDRYGHTAGDKLLTDLAALVAGEIREIDLAARYGGEEFLLILADTGIEGALEVSERIRGKTASFEFACSENLLATGVTVSMGVASWDEHVASGEILVARADTALYRAKRNGRNRFEAWIDSKSKADTDAA